MELNTYLGWTTLSIRIGEISGGKSWMEFEVNKFLYSRIGEKGIKVGEGGVTRVRPSFVMHWFFLLDGIVVYLVIARESRQQICHNHCSLTLLIKT